MTTSEYDNTGALIREYVYLNDQPLAQVDSGEVLTYLHTDHLGTPRYATNSAGTQVWNWNSDAFGNGTPSGSTTVNLRFAGQYWDDESSLHYNWNRFYDPETGRYISSDPIGLAGGLNTFGYALANPIMYIDPEGLKTSYCNRNSWQPTCQGAEGGGGGGARGSLGAGTLGKAIANSCKNLWNDIWNRESSEEDTDDTENRQQHCQALKDSILNTCASLTGKKKFKCFAAAQESYEQCME